MAPLPASPWQQQQQQQQQSFVVVARGRPFALSPTHPARAPPAAAARQAALAPLQLRADDKTDNEGEVLAGEWLFIQAVHCRISGSADMGLQGSRACPLPPRQRLETGARSVGQTGSHCTTPHSLVNAPIVARLRGHTLACIIRFTARFCGRRQLRCCSCCSYDAVRPRARLTPHLNPLNLYSRQSAGTGQESRSS